MEPNDIEPELPDYVKQVLGTYSQSERLALIEKVRSVLESEYLRAKMDPVICECPCCHSTDLVQYGKTAKGTQRWKCHSCGKVRCHIDPMSIMVNTKLTYEQWMEYAVCFVDHVTSSVVCKRVDVCPKTAWFMRVRTCEAIFKNLPAFQSKEGIETEVDGIYFRESFKGTSFENMINPPREPRTSREHYKSGISDDQICVLTAFDKEGNFFYDVACRGALTIEIGFDKLRDHISKGSVIITDKHKAYPKVMENLEVAEHRPVKAGEEGGVERLNHIHQGIREFMHPFHGVSTKWLHMYLAWFKWLRCFDGSVDECAGQVSNGVYKHTWSSIKEMPFPFRDESMNPMKC